MGRADPGAAPATAAAAYLLWRMENEPGLGVSKTLLPQPLAHHAQQSDPID